MLPIASDSGTSSFLQERLQRRREEAERAAAARLAEEMAAAAEPPTRTAQSSPVKAGSADGRRPGSSGSSEPSKKKGMGVKEMEATVSTLHKQNFDLKLELYHRRERQTTLEEKVEQLASEKEQLEEVNDRLLEELEKRDKAVQEAVQMIVLLEARVEKLVEEREMVRQVETAGYLADMDASLDAPTPKARAADLARLEEDVRKLNRMPSFVSEKTETTANLRNVYLGTRGNLTLPKLTEGLADTDPGRAGMVSPSLSVLSESSFASIYGEKESDDRYLQNDIEGVRPHAGSRAYSNPSDLASMPRSRTVTPSRGPRSGSFSRSGSGQYQSITDVIEQSSPLQRLERLEGYALNGASPSTDKVARTRSQSQSKTKQEKREALRRVMTDAPSPNGRPHFDQALPPTPDTISTSTLRRFKNSSGDTLVQQPNTTTNERSFLASSSQRAGEKPEPVPEHNGGAPIMAPSATTTRYEADLAHHGHGRPLKPQPRPRSADESTISHRKSKAWLQENGDEDDNASIMSLESSLDIWMQQGKEPKQVGRTSPDLFGFPTKTGGWETDAMFGPGASYGGGGAPLSWPDPLEDLVPIQQALFGGPGAPPPPNRRSSLHARTGSASTSRHPEPVMGKLRKSFGRRRDSTDSQMQANEAGPHTPQQTSEKQGQGQGRGPYPPFTRPATATPRDGRMKTLWRRSLGGTGSAAPPNASDLVPEPAVSTTPTGRQSINSGVGTPSWVHRAHMVDDDTRALGATPPPIQRQPRRGSEVEHEGAPVLDRGPSTPTMSVAPSLPSTPSGKGPTTSDPALAGAPGAGGGGAGAGGGVPLGNGAGTVAGTRRKWLPGFGRASSLRNRAG
ncbi:hypothetical protein VD0004_g4774 [Verticillium dahliae]|nr:hypothetical protein VD0004_g4774 [Verticillium dahliae]